MKQDLKREQRSKKVLYFIVLICLMVSGAGVSQSFAGDVSLNLSSGGGQTTETVYVTLSLAYPGAALATGFNLDIYYDRDVLENPSAIAGQILITAGKQISTSNPSHPYFGVLRIAVFGINQTIIQAGQAATIGFAIRATAPAGVTSLDLANLDATDAQGESLIVTGTNGSIDVVVGDSDEDGILDNVDNCPKTPNPNQEDTYPPQKNGIGDACDCEGDFTCDGDVDGEDVTKFLEDFGRGQYFNPCPQCGGEAWCLY